MNVNYIARKKAFFLPPLHPVKEIEKLPSRPSSANEIPNQSRTEDIEGSTAQATTLSNLPPPMRNLIYYPRGEHKRREGNAGFPEFRSVVEEARAKNNENKELRKIAQLMLSR